MASKKTERRTHISLLTFANFAAVTDRLERCLSKLATKLRREVGSYSFPSLVRTAMMNWLMYPFSSTAGQPDHHALTLVR
ncbi:hypothetical protein ACROYT_G037109 [Oculina patagonica]